VNADDLGLPQVRNSGAARTLGCRLACCVPLALLLCSCATPYKPFDHGYGYSERQVSNDVYEISFVANGNSSYGRAADFAMLRASEVALDHHARSFVVLNVVNLSSARAYYTSSHPYWTTSLYMSPADMTTLPPGGPVGWNTWSYQVMDVPEERLYYRPGVKLTIKLLSDPPGPSQPYDPAKEAERLRHKYHLNPTGP
jgi:hypothetical protein